MITDRRLPGLWLFLFTLALTALPLAAVTQQSLRLASGDVISVPARIVSAQNDSLVPLAKIDTPLHTVSLTALTGDNRFRIGDDAFLYVSRSAGQVYPFAILRRAPQTFNNDRRKNRGKDQSQVEDGAIMLRARVINVDGDTVRLSHSFDTISPPQSFISATTRNPAAPIALTLAVSPDGRASVSEFYIGDERFSQTLIRTKPS